jgi:GNAT superfamily N-acetyltransferase
MQSIVYLRARDRMAVSAFLERLSPATRLARYPGPVQLHGASREGELTRLESGLQTSRFVLLAKDGEHVRGIGEYVVAPADASRAEIALVVEDAFQDQGIGRMLFLGLEDCALGWRIRTFTGDVANANERVLSMLRRANRPLKMTPAYASTYFELSLRGCPESAATFRAA